MSAGQKLSPAWTASIGGKMRFPAPKNIENRASAVTMMALVERPFVDWPSAREIAVEPIGRTSLASVQLP